MIYLFSRHSPTLWVDPVDEDSISRIVTTWIITLEKQGCPKMIQAGESLTLYLIEAPFNAFANRADADQAALVRAAWSGSALLIDISEETISRIVTTRFITLEKQGCPK